MANSSDRIRRSQRKSKSSQNYQNKHDRDEELHSSYFRTSRNTTIASDNPVKPKKCKLDDSASAKQNLERQDLVETKTEAARKRLERSFYDYYAADLAKYLLGKRLYRVLEDGEILCGRVVETEGYHGETDRACHAYGGKKTSRTEAMYMAPGTAYVYFIYGMYFCLNISSKDIGGAVLIRALEPIEGIQRMTTFRGQKRSTSGKGLKEHELCNGPSKLCQAMNITKENSNKEDMISSKTLWIEDDPDITNDIRIVTSTRIGVNSYGQEAAQMPLRFYVYENKCVSVRDKNAEKLLD